MIINIVIIKFILPMQTNIVALLPKRINQRPALTNFSTVSSESSPHQVA